MKQVCLAALLVCLSLAVHATALTTQRVQNGRVISIGDSLTQLEQARPERRHGRAYGWRIDSKRYLWAHTREGRVHRLEVVLITPRRRR